MSERVSAFKCTRCSLPIKDICTGARSSGPETVHGRLNILSSIHGARRTRVHANRRNTFILPTTPVSTSSAIGYLMAAGTSLHSLTITTGTDRCT